MSKGSVAEDKFFWFLKVLLGLLSSWKPVHFSEKCGFFETIAILATIATLAAIGKHFTTLYIT